MQLIRSELKNVGAPHLLLGQNNGEDGVRAGAGFIHEGGGRATRWSWSWLVEGMRASGEWVR